jgi:uncharacterized protein (DUF433 family)
MNLQDRIEVNPEILVGKLVVKGTRLGVAFLLNLLAQGWTEDDVLHNYPGLTREDLQDCFAYASERVEEKRVHSLPPISS